MEENKIVFADFVEGDGFELNSYLTYLFNQCLDHIPEYGEGKLVGNRD